MRVPTCTRDIRELPAAKVARALNLVLGPVDAPVLARQRLGVLKNMREDKEKAQVRGTHAEEDVRALDRVP